MRQEQSFGVIPLQLKAGEWHVFLIKREKGFWECPKGHSEAGETPLQSAYRELFEETGLSVTKLLRPEPLAIHYYFTVKGVHISKSVLYFLATVEGVPHLQEAEVQDGLWVNLNEAINLATYPTIKSILLQTIEFLKQNPCLDFSN